MLYQLHEMQHALMIPVRIQAELTRTVFQSPLNPLSYTTFGRTIGAGAEMIERATKRFNRPEFGLNTTKIDGKTIKVTERVITEKPFCSLLRFKRKTDRKDPQVLLVAPMSGHYATLLRGTVEGLLPHHDVYVTDWEDARQVPLSEGRFNFDDYIAYLQEFMAILGPETHLIAVCQPAVPVLAAVSLMASKNDKNQPLSMTLMGGPIDTRVSKTEVTELAETRPLKWFESKVLYNVPFHYPGANRRVYPGFLQLSGFMSMNLDTHVGSHMKFYQHLIAGDGESSDRHRTFYDEYLSVMDIPAEFYLQTVEEVFQKHSLPRGRMKWTDPLTSKVHDVRPQDIQHTAMLTIEGELDDISARGQTTAAHELCHSMPQKKQYHHFQMQCGHYGIFNGRRWREEIMPRIRHFIRLMDIGKDPIPQKDLEETPDKAPERFNHDKHGIVAIRRWLKENQPENYKNVKRPPLPNDTPPSVLREQTRQDKEAASVSASAEKNQRKRLPSAPVENSTKEVTKPTSRKEKTMTTKKATKKAAPKKTAAKKPAAKKPAAKKTVAKKPAAKKKVATKAKSKSK